MKTSSILFSLFFALTVSSCVSRKPSGVFNDSKIPNPPDYSLAKYWAALPDKKDPSDLWAGNIEAKHNSDEVDIFYLSPTMYTGSKWYQKNWNAPVDYEKFNREVDNVAIQFQASIFNGVGRIYSPYYRQAHIKCYFIKDSLSCKKAFDVAYEDVENAFLYYLEHYNQGRPFIIASHSQGTTHAIKLIKMFLDSKPLEKKLVVAYLLGMPILATQFKDIPVCASPEQTGCFCSWRTFEKNYTPKKFPVSDRIAAVNPLTWTTDSSYASASLNKGAVFRDFKKIVPASNDAQIHQGILWTNKPKFKGSILLRSSNYHAGDFNIYYMNVRDNAKYRISTYWK